MNKLFTFLFFIFCSLISYSQNVGIGTNTPAASAALEIRDTSRGFLPPRMTYAQRIAISNPAQGLIIYCTDCGVMGELQFFDGLQWLKLSAGTASTPPLLPTINTISVSNISSSSAISGGNISSDGGAFIISKGVCWDTLPNPTILLNTKTDDGSGVSGFNSNITGLNPNTYYYVRSYATNSVGTTYGNQIFFNTSQITIGQNYAGGIVFYVDNSGIHGLVCETSGYNYGTWCSSFANVTGTSTAVGFGASNTALILANCPSSQAASICDALVINGYSDWYLPSLDELRLIYQNARPYIGYAQSAYWSSSQFNGSDAWYFQFNYQQNGNYGTKTKNQGSNVIAVRTF